MDLPDGSSIRTWPTRPRTGFVSVIVKQRSTHAHGMILYGINIRISPSSRAEVGNHFGGGAATGVIVWVLNEHDMDIVCRVPWDVAVDGFAAANIGVVGILDESDVFDVGALTESRERTAIGKIRDVQAIGLLLFRYEVLISHPKRLSGGCAQIIFCATLRLLGRTRPAAVYRTSRIDIRVLGAVERQGARRWKHE